MTKGPREAVAYRGPAYCGFPYRFSRSVLRRRGHKPFITDWFRGRGLLQTAQLKTSGSSGCPSSCEQREALSLGPHLSSPITTDSI